ncbi:MAG: hypothetical protein HYX25_09830 [Candidatus Solibacter usitatus]|nr:hypothetical protein [Candidatus Solibacter usitatus]
MVRVWFAAVVLSLCTAGAFQKAKTGDIDILEVTAQRGDDMIEIDGRVRNTSDKTIRGLTLSFDFTAPDGSVMTTQTAPVDEENLAAGKEAPFHMKLSNPARAVRFKVSALTESKRRLRVTNGGPFAID